MGGMRCSFLPAEGRNMIFLPDGTEMMAAEGRRRAWLLYVPTSNK